jgi:hypothetical protein
LIVTAAAAPPEIVMPPPPVAIAGCVFAMVLPVNARSPPPLPFPMYWKMSPRAELNVVAA